MKRSKISIMPNHMRASADTPFQLFFDQLRDLQSLEVQFSESMPHLVSLCTSDELRNLISSHARQKSNQIAEIDAIFYRHEESPGYDKCKAIERLIQGGTAHLERVQAPHTRDLMMIEHCLRIQYYEMAAFEITRLLSGKLGLVREPEILSDLLAEEMEMTAALVLLEPDFFETANTHK